MGRTTSSATGGTTRSVTGRTTGSVTGLTTRWTSSVTGAIALGSPGCSEPEAVAVVESESDVAVEAGGGGVADETVADREFEPEGRSPVRCRGSAEPFATCSAELVTDRTTSVGFGKRDPVRRPRLLPAEEPQHEQPADQQRHLQRTPPRRRARHAQSGIGQYG